MAGGNIQPTQMCDIMFPNGFWSYDTFITPSFGPRQNNQNDVIVSLGALLENGGTLAPDLRSITLCADEICDTFPLEWVDGLLKMRVGEPKS